MTFLEKWLYIIRNCSFDNSYKAAWAKAITEIAVEYDFHEPIGSTMKIGLEDIAKKVIRYYFEQTIFFDLKQSPNPNKPPKIVSLVKELIAEYQKATQSAQPVKWFRSNIELICETQYEKTVKQVKTALKADVSYRFLTVEGKVVDDVYSYERNADFLYIAIDNMRELKENSLIVFDAINYRWSQMLENFNHSPRICKKVKIIDEDKVRRKPLTKFFQLIAAENPDHICFHCGNKIIDETPAIDHVIPWSYLYSDDLWNLVYSHQTCNSSKSNVIPSETTIQRLEERNSKLLVMLMNQGQSNKHVSELEMAIINGLVRKFWISCQG
ncbi:HNH endonuclease [Paenibacillus sp. MZ04-78.2]|uniref:HNH endonuclease n=1 Tax=Paenibacillus sp. MZ04-78.2 TaxID=2962034 RepID=UPI0020B83242|nr:HNH endonuclease signature motif containing protein [Paenibacillus sp. MZ04-78.2]MCP3776707.1 HNH endonuclease [Paenibacillus sp. MZ04-78.2]